MRNVPRSARCCSRRVLVNSLARVGNRRREIIAVAHTHKQNVGSLLISAQCSIAEQQHGNVRSQTAFTLQSQNGGGPTSLAFVIMKTPKMRCCENSMPKLASSFCREDNMPSSCCSAAATCVGQHQQGYVSNDVAM
eukprot:1160828-Pelagomonas_calceolata.AAC.9